MIDPCLGQLVGEVEVVVASFISANFEKPVTWYFVLARIIGL